MLHISSHCYSTNYRIHWDSKEYNIPHPKPLSAAPRNRQSQMDPPAFPRRHRAFSKPRGSSTKLNLSSLERGEPEVNRVQKARAGFISKHVQHCQHILGEALLRGKGCRVTLENPHTTCESSSLDSTKGTMGKKVLAAKMQQIDLETVESKSHDLQPPCFFFRI